jgi:hypothetical protein
MPAEEIPTSPHFHALAVTLLGFAGGESLPLPRSKGGAFPLRSAERSAELVAGSRRSLLTRDGYPTAFANVTQRQGISTSLSGIS